MYAHLYRRVLKDHSHKKNIKGHSNSSGISCQCKCQTLTPSPFRYIAASWRAQPPCLCGIITWAHSQWLRMVTKKRNYYGYFPGHTQRAAFNMHVSERVRNVLGSPELLTARQMDVSHFPVQHFPLPRLPAWLMTLSLIPSELLFHCP